MAESERPAADDASTVDLTELTLKERIVLATAQQPAIGLLIIVLFLFALAFLVALVLTFPAVAGLFALGTVVLVVVGIGLFLVLRRFDSA